MRNEETEIRIEAMRRLDVVARALGPDNTVDELVPFLIGEPLPCVRARPPRSAPHRTWCFRNMAAWGSGSRPVALRETS